MPRYLKSLLALLLFGIPATLMASPITISTDFSFDSFTNFGGSGDAPPFTTVSGSFTLTFDPTVEVTDAAVTSISFDNPSLPFSTTGIQFSNTLTLVGGGFPNFLLDIYSTDLPVQFATDDFLLRLAGLPSVGLPGAGQLLYAESSLFAVFSSNSATTLNTTVTTPTGSVPEPAPLILLALGLASLVTRSRLGNKKVKA